MVFSQCADCICIVITRQEEPNLLAALPPHRSNMTAALKKELADFFARETCYPHTQLPASELLNLNQSE